MNVYTAYLSNSLLVLTSYNVTNISGTKVNELIFNTSALNPPLSNLKDSNYFISNNTGFLIISSELNNYSYINIFDLSNNQTFKTLGDNNYNIGSINRFTESPDVYFSIYNSTTYLLVKYSFQTNSFSTILIKTVPTNNLVQVMKVRTAMIQDKFYISIIAGSSDNNLNNYTSYMYIFDNQAMIFKKTFSSVAVTSFTIVPDGLLLYSFSYLNDTSQYFQYFYANDSLVPVNTMISYFQYNDFSPYTILPSLLWVLINLI